MSAQTKDRSQAGLDRIWDIIEKVGVCMLTTQFPGGLRARPLEARPDHTLAAHDERTGLKPIASLSR